MPTPVVPDRKAVTPPWNSRLSRVGGKEKEVVVVDVVVGSGRDSISKPMGLSAPI